MILGFQPVDLSTRSLQLGYSKYRRVLGYYSNAEDALGKSVTIYAIFLSYFIATHLLYDNDYIL